jgi:uncharacterized protein (DUF4415 family)
MEKKKSSVSSQPELLKRMSSEGIRSRKLSERERETVRRIAARQAEGEPSAASTRLIPLLSDHELAAMVRLREARPRKTAVSVRLDESVLKWLRSKGSGHLTRINDILSQVMQAEQRAGRG